MRLALLLMLLQSLPMGSRPIGSAFTTTLIQHPTNLSCTTAACSVTTTATTAGNILVFWSAVEYVGTGSFANVMDFSSVTDNGTAETWKHCPNSVVNDANASDTTLFALDCWYVESAAGGATSVTGTWTLVGLPGGAPKIDSWFVEYHPSATAHYNTGNALSIQTSCANCVGPAGLLSGSNAVSQAIIYPTTSGAAHVTAASAPYSNPADFDNTNNIFGASAGALNQTTYSAITWTQANSGNPRYAASSAFGSNATPALTGNIFLDWHTCTNGAGLSTVCGNASTSSGWSVTGDTSNSSTGATTCTATIASSLPAPVIVNGVSNSGSASSIDFCGVTNTSGTHIGYYLVNNPTGLMSMSVGFSIKSSCPATGIDCASTVRLGTIFGDVLSIHFSPLGDGHFCLENPNVGCTGHEGGTYAANTVYRVNLLMTGYSAGTSKMRVCTDGPGGTALQNLTTSGPATDHTISFTEVGITGEEPTTAGITYEVRNLVAGTGDIYGLTSGCF